jgi:hypothetical protein
MILDDLADAYFRQSMFPRQMTIVRAIERLKNRLIPLTKPAFDAFAEIDGLSRPVLSQALDDVYGYFRRFFSDTCPGQFFFKKNRRVFQDILAGKVHLPPRSIDGSSWHFPKCFNSKGF